MATLTLVLLVAALVLAVLATAAVPAGRYSLLAGAFACYVASLLAGRG